MRISLEQWRRGGGTFDFRGHAIFTRTEGGGPPAAADAASAAAAAAAAAGAVDDPREALLLIHGFPTSSHDFAELWPALTRRFRVLTLDMLGFGLSAKPWPHAYSIFEQADLFAAFLAEQRITSVRLLAHDYGVTVAQELVARHNEQTAAAAEAGAGNDEKPDEKPAPPRPDRSHPVIPVPIIREVVLLNGGILPELHRPFRIQRLLASRLGPIIARLTSYRTFAANMQNLWGTRLPSDEDLRQLWSAVAEQRGTRVMPGLIGYMAERRQHRDRWVGALEQLDAPLSIIIGLDDPISGAHVAAGCRDVFPQAKVIDLPGVGHYPQLEAPEQVLAALPWRLAAD